MTESAMRSACRAFLSGLAFVGCAHAPAQVACPLQAKPAQAQDSASAPPSYRVVVDRPAWHMLTAPVYSASTPGDFVATPVYSARCLDDGCGAIFVPVYSAAIPFDAKEGKKP